jgi:hypothetical protein
MTAEYTILQRTRHENLVKRVQERWLEGARPAVN